MEKRKPTFEKWDIEKYGSISYKEDPIILVTANEVSVSKLGILIRKERNKPGKYFVIVSPNLSVMYRMAIVNYSKNIPEYDGRDFGVVYTMTESELKEFVYKIIVPAYAKYRIMISSFKSVAMDTLAAKLTFDKMVDFIIGTSFVSGEVELSEEQAEQLADIMNDTNDEWWYDRGEITVKDFKDMYSDIISDTHYPNMFFHSESGHTEISIDGIYFAKYEEDDKIYMIFFDEKFNDRYFNLDTDHHCWTKIFGNKFRTNSLIKFKFNIFVEEVLPAMMVEYSDRGDKQMVVFLSNIPDLLTRFSSEFHKKWGALSE